MNNRCPTCGSELLPDAVLCPKCLLKQGLAGQEQSDSTAIEENTNGQGPRTPREVAPSSIRYFGDYEILEEIARGGMGVVYKARQMSLNRVVAVKLILSGELATEREVQRFYSEAQAAANLQHPNIVAIHEVGAQGRHYFSMDYVDGPDLGQRIRSGPLEPVRAANLLKKITEAVAYAHMQGTLHRDLKPSNILLDSKGEPRITDFGLAKRSGARDAVTVEGAVLGTPAYMPPEQASGRIDRIDARSDVYGLGAVLYALLAGKAPFSGETPLAIMRDVVDRLPQPPSRLNPRVPSELELICLKCLEKNPENRYQNAIELAADLNRFLQGQPVQARAASPFMRGMDRLRKNPWALTGSLSFAMLWLLLALFSLWDYAQFAVWKSKHPAQKFPEFTFFSWLNRAGDFRLVATAWLFGYLFLIPPYLYSYFALTKRKNAITLKNLRSFTIATLFNTALGIMALCRGIHFIIWNGHGAFGLIAVFSLAFIPAFWFGAHLLWLIAAEWRGRQFGEQVDEVKAVYGDAPLPPRKKFKGSRVTGNLFLGLVAIYSITSDLLNITRMVQWIVWMLFAGIALVYFRRRSILEWKAQSRVSNQLFWFMSIALTAFLCQMAIGMFEISKGPEQFRLLISFVVALIAAFTSLGWAEKVSKTERPASLWSESRFYQFLEASWKNKLAFIVLAVAVVFFLCPTFNWAMAITFTSQLIKDLLEFALNHNPRRRRELALSLLLLCFLLFHLHSNPSGAALNIAILVGLICGAMETSALFFTLPRARRFAPLSLAFWAAELAMVCLTSFFLWSGPFNVAQFRAGLWNLNQRQALIDMISGPMLNEYFLSSEVEALIKSYASLHLFSAGVKYFERTGARFGGTSPQAFKAEWIIGQLLLAQSKQVGALPANDSAEKRYRALSKKFHLIPADKWSLAGPVPFTNTARAATQINAPLPGLLQPDWKSASDFAPIYSGIVDLTEKLPTSSRKSLIYARISIISPADQTVSLRFGLQGDLDVWLNSAEILRARHKLSFNLDNAVVLAKLKKGPNDLLLRLTTEPAYSSLMARILSPSGQPITGLQYE